MVYSCSASSTTDHPWPTPSSSHLHHSCDHERFYALFFWKYSHAGNKLHENKLNVVKKKDAIHIVERRRQPQYFFNPRKLIFNLLIFIKQVFTLYSLHINTALLQMR